MRGNSLLTAIQTYLDSQARVVSYTPSKERQALLEEMNAARARQRRDDILTQADGMNAVGGSVAFKHVMVAVDTSDQASFALDVAAHLANDLHAEMSLVHVVHLPPVTNPDLADENIALRPVCLEGGQELLDRLAEGLPPGIQKVLREGDPATHIIDAATRLGADLLVMGTHGRGRFAAAIVGSVAHKVMQKVTCPVLCVAHTPEHSGTNHVKAATLEQPELEVRPCLTI